MSDLYRPFPATGNAVVDGQLTGNAWNTQALTYSFAYGDINRNGIPDFNEGDWQDFYREILANVSAFTNLTFSQVAEPGNINFRLREGGGGEAGVPAPGVTSVDSVVGIDANVPGSAAVVRLGTYSETWFHELGHSLGLKHPHDESNGIAPLPGVTDPASKGTGHLNSQIYSVMGYTFPFWGEDNPFTTQVDFDTPLNAQPGSFGALDIAALQAMYGARPSATGNNVYTFSDDVDANRGYTTLWDTGGIDEIRYTGTSRAKLDLRPATLQPEVGGGGWLSTSETLTGGFTIAQGVTIENATGGQAADLLIGNNSGNQLKGLGGNDRLQGLAGNDILEGGDGDDVLEGGAGNDQLFGGNGNDTAVFSGARSLYSVLQQANGLLLFTDLRNGAPDGRDSMLGVENFQFADGVLSLAALNPGQPSPGAGPNPTISVADPSIPTVNLSLPGLSDNQGDFLVALYVAAFNRAPDFAGITYWSGEVSSQTNAGLSSVNALSKVAASLYAAGQQNGETGTRLDNGAYVDFLYQNVLGRPADAAGLAYWTADLDRGAPRDSFIATYLTAALEHQSDATHLAARVAVAKYAARIDQAGGQPDLAGVLTKVSDGQSAQTRINQLQQEHPDIELTQGQSSLALIGQPSDSMSSHIG